jgi:UDP-N-acetylmuramate--alanine ligase
MRDNNFLCNKKFHFVGIGGVSMSALAEYSHLNGAIVSGSDQVKSAKTDRLVNLGCKIYTGHRAKNVRDADAVIYTVATSNDNPEIRYAKKKGIPVYTRGEFLGSVMDRYENSVAISGCHGKTTTTAMIASVLISAGKDPTVFLGGDHYEFGNFRAGHSNFAITEACEYKKSFLNIRPKIAVVLNVGNDHLDTYGNIDEVISAFNKFIGNNFAIVNADDMNSKQVFNASTVTFGINNLACYRATQIKNQKGAYSFNLNAYSINRGRVKLKVLGYHNIYNALATFAVCDILGISFSHIKKGLEEFLGVKRRNEYLGKINGVEFFADYAHHPDEIKVMLDLYKQNGDNFLTVFQPHTYSRTKLLMDDFVCNLKRTNPLIIYDTYPAREKYDEDGSAHALYNMLREVGQEKVYYAQDEGRLIGLINECSVDVNRVLILGAGDVYEKIKKLLF